MLNFLILVEDQEREDTRLEDFKSTILTAFPSKSMYKDLYSSSDKTEVIEAVPTSYEDIRDIMSIISSNQFGDESEIPYG